MTTMKENKGKEVPMLVHLLGKRGKACQRTLTWEIFLVIEGKRLSTDCPTLELSSLTFLRLSRPSRHLM